MSSRKFVTLLSDITVLRQLGRYRIVYLNTVAPSGLQTFGIITHACHSVVVLEAPPTLAPPTTIYVTILPVLPVYTIVYRATYVYVVYNLCYYYRYIYTYNHVKHCVPCTGPRHLHATYTVRAKARKIAGTNPVLCIKTVYFTRHNFFTVSIICTEKL